MPVQMTDLKPYKSFTVARAPENYQIRSIINAVLEDAKEIAGLVKENDRIITEARSHKLDPLWDDESIWIGYIHYIEHRVPSWFGGDDELTDETNELFLVLQYNRHFALYMSDSRRNGALRHHLGNGQGRGLGALRPLARGILNAAYVNGKTRTVWLSGVHAPVSVKADNKVLSGKNLRDALDPLDDQTYHFTAARSSVESLHLPVGVAPRSSRIWVGATYKWSEFISTTAALLRHLEQTTTPDLEPLPVVAIEVTQAPDLSDAFELHFASPELLSDSPDIDEETKGTMERWAYRSNFEIVNTEDSTLHCKVTLDGSDLGHVSIELDTTDPEKVSIVDVKVDPAENSDPAAIAELKKVCHKITWLNIWFESGHTIANGAIFSVRHRDMPFTNYRWIDLTGYCVKEEKFWTKEFPKNAKDIIGTKHSLFCWVKNNWANPNNPSTAVGWLACDDGSMEIADFIHLDDTQSPPVLSMIHVKGAGSKDPNRGISVSSYEVVVGQAVKNLRHLDRINMAEGLRAGLEHKMSTLVWHNGVHTTRQEMLSALDRIGAHFKRRVVVLQPHVTKSKYDEIRTTAEHKEFSRMRQLDTLLLAAEASCRDLGAEFVVYGDDNQSFALAPYLDLSLQK